MHKTLVNVICAFVPKRKCRHRLRNKLLSRFQKTGLVNPNFIVSGQNNKLILIDEQGNEKPMTTNIPGMRINVQGDNNTIRIHLPIICRNCFIGIRNNNAYVELGSTKGPFDMRLFIQSGISQKFIMKKNTTMRGVDVVLTEQSQCFIGEDCMFADKILFHCADDHSVLDVKTGEVLNRADAPLIIGNHVWIAEWARLTKNTHIYDNSIVACGAVACKDYKESGVVIAGNPGQIVKKGITWSRLNPYDIQKQKENKK